MSEKSLALENHLMFPRSSDSMLSPRKICPCLMHVYVSVVLLLIVHCTEFHFHSLIYYQHLISLLVLTEALPHYRPMLA